MSLILKKAATHAITISMSIETNEGPLEGDFIGHARIFSKAEAKKIVDGIVADAEKKKIPDADEATVRAFYERFDGLGNESGALTGEAAFEEVLKGPYSSFLTLAVIRAFYEQIGEVARGNSKPSRKR